MLLVFSGSPFQVDFNSGKRQHSHQALRLNSLYLISLTLSFPGGSDSKAYACNTGDLGSIPGLGRSPGGGHGNPLQYSCLENPHGQKSLAGYRPKGHKKLDMTE